MVRPTGKIIIGGTGVQRRCAGGQLARERLGCDEPVLHRDQDRPPRPSACRSAADSIRTARRPCRTPSASRCGRACARCPSPRTGRLPRRTTRVKQVVQAVRRSTTTAAARPICASACCRTSAACRSTSCSITTARIFQTNRPRPDGPITRRTGTCTRSASSCAIAAMRSNVPSFYDGGRFRPQSATSRRSRSTASTMRRVRLHAGADRLVPAAVPRAAPPASPTCRRSIRKSSPGEPMWDTLKDATIKRGELRRLRRPLPHQHAESGIPGPFDFRSFCTKLARRAVLPGVPAGSNRAPRTRTRRSRSSPTTSGRAQRNAAKAAVLAQRGQGRRRVLPGRPRGASARLWHGRRPPHRQSATAACFATLPRAAGRGADGPRLGGRPRTTSRCSATT